MIRDLNKVFGHGRHRRFAALALCIGEPLGPAKQRFRTRELPVVEGADATHSAWLKDFLAALTRPPEA